MFNKDNTVFYMFNYNISDAICDELKSYYDKYDLFYVDEFYQVIDSFSSVKSIYDELIIPNTNKSEWLLIELICDQLKTYLVSDDEYMELLETICNNSNKYDRKPFFKVVLDESDKIKAIKYYGFIDALKELKGCQNIGILNKGVFKC